MTPAPNSLACLRRDAEGDARLAGLDAVGWRALMDRLRTGRGLAFLERRLQQCPAAGAPPWVKEELRATSRAIAGRTLLTLARLIPCLADVGAPVMALKGLDLAHRVYPHIGLRPMNDIDLLVPVDALTALDRAFRNRGYQPDLVLTPAALAEPWHHHIRYQPPPGAGLQIELHWKLSGHERTPDSLAELWKRSRPLEKPALPVPIHVMAPEDMLLYLCEHIVHHAFETPLTQLWDLAEVMDWGGDTLDWPLFWRRASDIGLTHGAQLCLHKLESTLGVRHPAASAAGPPHPPPADVVSAVPDMLEQLGRFPGHRHGHTLRLTAVLSSRKGLAYRLALARRILLPASGELATQSGQPTSSPWLAPLHLIRHWHGIWRRKRGLLSDWLDGRGEAQHTLRRRGRLLAWLQER